MPPAAQPANPKPPHARASARLVATVGATIGLCIMGDSLMYSILPLHAPALGFTLPMVGILLSANRLVRLLSNKWAGDIFERWGARVPFLGAVILGLLSTAFYGVSAGFLVFLLARMAWGVAWSGLRQGGYAALWTGGGGARGRLTGLLWGLVRLGSAVGVFAGGLLYDRRGYGAAIAAILAAGLFALPVALAARWPAGDKAQSGIPSAEGDEAPLETAAPATWRQLAEAALQAPLQRWLTLASFFAYLLSGIIVSTTSVFLAARFGSGAGAIFFGLGVAALTGLLHSARWLTDLLLGPLVGWLSDYAGQANTLAALGVLMLLALLGASTLPGAAAVACLFAALLLDSSIYVVISAAASNVALRAARPHVFVAAFATISDAGAALGPLTAFSIAANAERLPLVYLTAAAALLLALLQFRRVDRVGAAIIPSA